jgi:membrane protein YdbS with pleckstrin-like domain
MTQHDDQFPLPAGARPAAGEDELLMLDRRAVSAWRINALLDTALVALLCVAASAALIWFDGPGWIVPLPLLLVLVIGVLSIGILPERRWRSWRYAIGESEIELRQGVWWQSRTRIPMARVQHVDTRRGPIERRYGLAELVLYTAAGSRLIPGLALETAEASRESIALLANVRDDV